MQDQRARVDWRNGTVPVARAFDDPYFSLQDGLAEARHVFLGGNDLPARLRPGFQIAELGFGTGLNLLATLQAAADRPGPMRYTAFEAFPMAPEDMARALGAFPDLPTETLLAPWRAGRTRFAIGALEVTVLIGDARATLPAWQGRADAWYLDGFAPAKNPELWEPALMAEVARHTARGGSFATYSAAGAVRRALAAAGFTVARAAGFGRKRHMTRGRLA